MEEKSSVQNEENREDLLQELQDLRREVNRLNDKLNSMEGPASDEAGGTGPESGYEQSPNDRPAYKRQPDGPFRSDRFPNGQPRQPYQAGKRSDDRKRASVIPELRRQRQERRKSRLSYQADELNVGKYGSAFLAAVCILAGCGILMVSAWALADELMQAVLMFGLGFSMAGIGWLLHMREVNSAVPATLAACGLGILYMDCVSLHFLWHLLPVEGVLFCILVWAVLSFFMAFTGGTLLFYYVINLGNLATAYLVSSRTDGVPETWAGLLFTAAAYGFTLFQVFHIGISQTEKNDGISVNWQTQKLRWLKNVTAVNVLAAYTLLFSWGSIRRTVFTSDSLIETEFQLIPLLIAALLLGGVVLLLWRDLYQGGAWEEGTGVLVVVFEMGGRGKNLAGQQSGRWDRVAGPVYLAVLLLFLLPLIRAGNRNMITACILYPMLWVGLALSDFITGDIYLVPYIILIIYYLSMLFDPAFCKICAFVPAYTIMYLLLIGEAGHPEADITFALLTLFALGVPVRYVVKMINGQSWNELDREGQLSDISYGRGNAVLTFRQVSRYGVAMLAAFVVCVTYCSKFEKPFVLALEAVMLMVFTGMTLWMKNRDCRFFPVLCAGMVLLWLMSWRVLEWCMGDGFGMELAAGSLFLLAGSLAAWCGIRYGAGQKQGELTQLMQFWPPGAYSEYMIRRLGRLGVLYCPVSLAMFSLSLYRMLLVFQIPYGVFVSLLLLAAAVVILLLGFWLSSRSVRTYALFLMVICVVKMVTADLAGTGWIYWVGALAGGGVLCMIVSFIYSCMERREKDRQQD